MTQDRAQRAAIQFLVVRDDDLRKGGITPKDDMAAFLPSDGEASTLESLNAFPAGDDRQLAHRFTISTSKFSGGTAR